MADVAYRKIPCPHMYYPDGDKREMWRFEATAGGKTIGFADYFIENDWLHYLVYWMHPQARTFENVREFICQGYLAEPQIKQSFWWNTPSVMKQYFDMIVVERPDITFAASGAINKVEYATV